MIKRIERSCPTASGISVSGKMTVSRSGSTGSFSGSSGGDAHRDLLAAGARGRDLDHDSPSACWIGTVVEPLGATIGSSTVRIPSS